jgi:F-type H+-transporting ATPase subunit epsilon
VADASLQVELVSPERPLFRGKAESVVAEGHSGSLGILPGHAPLLSLLGTGVVRLRAGGKDEGYVVRGGFLQVLGGKVTLLVTQAVRADDVDAEKARAALAKTLEALRSPATDADFARLLDDRRWWESQLKAAGAA